MSVFWIFRPFYSLISCLMALVCIPEVQTHLLTPILPYLDMTNVRCRMRHLCRKSHKCHIWRKCHSTYMLCLDMAIWMSKDPSGPQEYRSILLNNLWMGLTAWNYKILTLQIFLCIFQNFLRIMEGLRGRASNQARELKFFLVNPDT